MERGKIIDQICFNNDLVGVTFQNAIERHTASYKQGVIHHEAYITEISLCCERAKKELLPYPKEME